MGTEGWEKCWHSCSVPTPPRQQKGISAPRRGRGEEGAQQWGPRSRRGAAGPHPSLTSQGKAHWRDAACRQGSDSSFLGEILMVPIFLSKSEQNKTFLNLPIQWEQCFAFAGMLKLFHFPFGNWASPVLFSVLFCNPNTQSCVTGPQSISASLTFSNIGGVSCDFCPYVFITVDWIIHNKLFRQHNSSGFFPHHISCLPVSNVILHSFFF